MRWAKSILYGGMLVDAEKSDYKDSERLLLCCPFCKEGVYLVKRHRRDEHARLAPKSKEIVLVKESIVLASFAHYHGVAQKCELKSRTISKKEVERAIADRKK